VSGRKAFIEILTEGQGEIGREIGRGDMKPSLDLGRVTRYRRTDGLNPSSSTGESKANPISWIMVALCELSDSVAAVSAVSVDLHAQVKLT
jgi:hypothetical protein